MGRLARTPPAGKATRDTETKIDGQIVRAYWGDADYEYAATVAPENLGRLALALAVELLGGREDAYSAFRDLCRRHDIPVETWSWA